MASPNPSANASAGTSGTGMPTNRTATGRCSRIDRVPATVRPGQSAGGAYSVSFEDSFDNVLLKSGMRHPPGRCRCKVGTWPANRSRPNARRRSSACNHLLRPVVKDRSFIRQGDFFGLPAGSYYVFSTTHANHLALSWDVARGPEIGTNSLVLDQKNRRCLAMIPKGTV